MTANDLIASAMRMTGALASGEAPQASEAADVLTIANRMLDSWQAEKLNIFSVNPVNFPIIANTQSYTLGTGKTWNMARPARIDRYGVIDSITNPAQPIEVPVADATDDDWAGVILKQSGGRWPKLVWNDGGYPTRTLWYWPVPNVNLTAVLWVWQPLLTFPDLVTDITYPPGYQDAVTYNLAIRLYAEGIGRPGEMSAAIPQLAADAIYRIKCMNMEPIPLDCDSRAIVDNRKRFYIYAGY